MGPWWGPVIAAGISAVGQWFTNRSAQNFAQKQSTTNYQRAVHDMQAAGLNPMLAYQQGGAPNASFNPQNPLASAVPAASSAASLKYEAMTTAKNVENTQASTELLNQQKTLAEWNTEAAKWTARKARNEWEMSNLDTTIWNSDISQRKALLLSQVDAALAGIKDTEASARLKDVNARIGKATAVNAEWEAERTNVMHEFGKTFGPGREWLKFLPSAINSMSATSAKALAGVAGL